jgi:hypothetical protein
MMDRTTGANAAQAPMVHEPMAAPPLFAVLSIKAVTSDFDFVGNDGDYNRLTMTNGSLQWCQNPDGWQNPEGWRPLSSDPITLQAATGALSSGDFRTCLPSADVEKLLLVAQTEILSHVTMCGVTDEVEFVDADGHRNRLAMMNGKLQWQTVNGATGWQLLSDGPVVLDQLTGSITVAKATARVIPEDLNLLLQAALLGKDEAAPAQLSQPAPLPPAKPEGKSRWRCAGCLSSLQVCQKDVVKKFLV